MTIPSFPVFLFLACLFGTVKAKVRSPSHLHTNERLLAVADTLRIQELADIVAAKASSARQKEDGSHRSLAVDEDAFRTQICREFERGFVSAGGTSCTCQPSTLSIECTARNICEEESSPDCENVLCADAKALVDWTEVDSTTIRLDALHMRWVYLSGTDYEASRVSIVKDECEVTYQVSGLEFTCNECTVCDSEGGNVKLDCSNIQPGATTGDICLEEAAPDSAFDETAVLLCPEGGVPTPTTEGMKPVQLSSLRSGAASDFKMYSIASLVAGALALMAL